MTATDQNTSQRPLNGFEGRLLSELRQTIAERATPAPPLPVPAGRPRFTRPLRVRRLALGLTTAAALVAGLAIGLPLAGGESANAAGYAIDKQGDGTITVTIRDWDNPEALERDLEAAGIPAEVDVLPVKKFCEEPRFKRAAWPDDKILLSTGIKESGVQHITLRPDDFRPGWTLVLTSQPDQDFPGGGRVRYGAAAEVADGPVAPCVPVDRPPVISGR